MSIYFLWHIAHRYVLNWSLLRETANHRSGLRLLVLVGLALRPCLEGYSLLWLLYGRHLLLRRRCQRLLLLYVWREGIVGRGNHSLCEHGGLTSGYLLRLGLCHLFRCTQLLAYAITQSIVSRASPS